MPRRDDAGGGQRKNWPVGGENKGENQGKKANRSRSRMARRQSRVCETDGGPSKAGGGTGPRRGEREASRRKRAGKVLAKRVEFVSGCLGANCRNEHSRLEARRKMQGSEGPVENDWVLWVAQRFWTREAVDGCLWGGRCRI